MDLGDRRDGYRNRAPATTQRTVLQHVVAWGVMGMGPYVGLMVAYFVSELSGGIADIPELLGGAIWVALYLLVPAVLAAGMLGITDIGLLVILRRAKFNHWIRAAIPAVVVGFVAMGLFSAYVLMTMFNLYGTGHYYAWAAAGAGALAVGVYVSHAWHYRSNDTERLAENMQP